MAMGGITATGWSFQGAATFVALWTVMMVAMMLPAAAPMIVIFAAAQGRRAGEVAVPTSIFVAGYFIVWAAAGAVVYALVQMGSDLAAGFAPPELCVKVEAGPKQCLDDNQCNMGYACVGGECTQKPSIDDEPKDTGPKKNWVSISIAPDISIFSGKDVCAVDVQDRDHFVCVRNDGSRYLGAPTPGVNAL